MRLISDAISTPGTEDFDISGACGKLGTAQAQLLDRAEACRMLLLGSVIATASLLAAGWSAWQQRSGQSTLFVALTFCQLVIAITGRPRGQRLAANRMLLASVVLNVALVLAAVTVPGLQKLFNTRALTGGDLLAAVLASVVAGFAMLVVRSRELPSPVLPEQESGT